jgi:hypothetical protein
MLIQRKSSAMRSISSVPFRFARPAKISSISFLFSAEVMANIQVGFWVDATVAC